MNGLTGENSTRGATGAAYLRRKESDDAVQPELQRLDQKAAELAMVEEALMKFAGSVDEDG